MHEHRGAVDVGERALAAGEQAGNGALRAVVEPLLTDALAARGQGERCRQVGPDGFVKSGDEAGVELGDQDPDRAAAREAHLGCLVVGDAVLADTRRAAVEHLLRLPDHGGLDAPTGDRPCDLAQVVQGE